MKPFKVPSNVVQWYITGRLKHVKEEKRQGELKDGYLYGILEGEQFIDREKGLPYSMKLAIEGLKLQDPEFGIGNYPQPKKVTDENRREYLRGYIRGLLDTIQIFTFKDYKSTAILSMQSLDLE